MTSLPSPRFSDYRHHIWTITQSALKAVDPYHLVTRALKNLREEYPLRSLELSKRSTGSLYLIALGKAAARMTQAILDTTDLHIRSGVIAQPSSEVCLEHPGVKVFLAGHPHPTAASMKAGEAAERILHTCSPDDIVLVLISGGGSALFELPRPGISLNDLYQLNQILLDSGLPIQDINIIRSALSRIKGGGLARLAYPARVISLILSDVIGDPLGSIASGPTVLQPDRRPRAQDILVKARLWSKIPAAIQRSLGQTDNQDTKARRPINVLIGGNRQLIDEAVSAAERLAYDAHVLSRQMRGEARHVGRKLGRQFRRRLSKLQHPTCFILGGETTVTVAGDGRGGRNQELALAAALEIEGLQQIALASFASDGMDGPTEAAGAIVDGETIGRMRLRGIDPQHELESNNAYKALGAVGTLIITGPTGTNVADLVLGMLYPDEVNL